MDLLASLGLANELPEQSSRLTSHPGILKALNGSSEGEDDDDDDDGVQLGFNRCLNCGDKFDADNGKPVSCKGCKRVKYCSQSCRKSDSQASEQDEEIGCGHSPVICSLLSLCNDDEAAEEELFNNSKAGGSSIRNGKKEAALYRVQTERESYPATLFNILVESPDWFIEAITSRLRCKEDSRSPEPSQRRGKRDRASPVKPPKETRELVLHIVGASVDSELWGWNGKEKGNNVPVLNAYAEASTNITSYLKNMLVTRACSIRLVFVGPDCPKSSPCHVEVPIPNSKSTLVVETHCCNYGGAKQPNLPAPDAIVFFNPGFSCPDYDWSKALSAACAYQSSNSLMGPTPFLITTNTEMEGFADVKCLLDGGYVDAKSLPGDILEAVDHPATGEDEEEDEGSSTFFFSENPYSGLRVRQSGTMGNDLYVKNRWIVGGFFRSGAAVGVGASKKKREGVVGKSKADSDEDKEKKRARKNGDSGGSKNIKKRNPALI